MNKIRKIVPKFAKKKPGTAPGTIQHVGEQRIEHLRLTVYDYDESHFEVTELSEVGEAGPFINSPSKTWLSIFGLHDIEKIKTIWSYFELHPLVQEDILNTTQRPKIEIYENNLYLVLKMLSWSAEKNQIESEQTSIVLSNHYLLSFQESDHPIFAPVVDRLQRGNMRIRRNGPDYLAYALADTIVDHYYEVLDRIGERIEELEEELLNDPGQETLQQIHSLRRDLIFFRKSVWPLRDMINMIIRDENDFIEEDTKLYLRDVYDHVIQVIDTVENYREMMISMQDMYMNHVSNKMNEVMKLLTIIATIFIPLTFIAGIYGMNFDPEASPYNLPELGWYWGYPAALAVMAVIAAVMVYFFRRKDWL